MLHLQKINAKHLAVYTLTMFFLMVLLPLCAIKVFPGLLPDDKPAPYDGKIPKEIRLYRTETGRTETISFETYIEGVVASEMPSSFHTEALKAQAVASRTYALGRINAGSKLCDSVHCQVYRSDNISSKTHRAVRDTAGQVLVYREKLAAHALYFSSSAGNTENSEDVFVNAVPYLVSVSSSLEPGASHKKETVTMTLSAFRKKMRRALPGTKFGTIRKSNIKIESHTKGGRTAAVKIGSAQVTGTDVRAALGLYSARFTISFKGRRIIFTTSGSGHGVGMSQYGANGLARKGDSYDKILRHYYRGANVSQ